MRRLTLTLALFLLIPRLLYGQVAIDAVTDGTAQNGASTQTFSHTVSGSNRLLIVACAVHGSGIPITSVTYNGSGMTNQARGPDTINPSVSSELWSTTAPATGAHNVVVTLPAGNDFSCVAASFTGVDQTTPLGTCVADGYSVSGTSHSHNTTGGANGLIWDAFVIGIAGGTVTVNGGQTTQTGPVDTSSTRAYVTSKTGTGTVSTGYSWQNDFNLWGHATCPILAVAAASTSRGGLLLHGVGP